MDSPFIKQFTTGICVHLTDELSESRPVSCTLWMVRFMVAHTRHEGFSSWLFYFLHCSSEAGWALTRLVWRRISPLCPSDCLLHETEAQRDLARDPGQVCTPPPPRPCHTCANTHTHRHTHTLHVHRASQVPLKLEKGERFIIWKIMR